MMSRAGLVIWFHDAIAFETEKLERDADCEFMNECMALPSEFIKVETTFQRRCGEGLYEASTCVNCDFYEMMLVTSTIIVCCTDNKFYPSIFAPFQCNYAEELV